MKATKKNQRPIDHPMPTSTIPQPIHPKLPQRQPIAKRKRDGGETILVPNDGFFKKRQNSSNASRHRGEGN
jgi:hypothetical protein